MHYMASFLTHIVHYFEFYALFGLCSDRDSVFIELRPDHTDPVSDCFEYKKTGNAQKLLVH